MNAERSQLYYTCVFLHVSFQAIQHSVAISPSDDETPCWLDSQMLRMLLSELQRCRREAATYKDIQPSLEAATYHCGLLMAQCPAAVNRKLCLHHLEAIVAPLKEATAQLSGKTSRVARSRASSPGQRLLSWLGW
ncbi:MAG: hypothetical protein LPK08_12425 [Halomonas sp.]|nr:hypothetical protein [Halomonas sp.]MDX5503568.1 hypothetical protein [Halomonas sp.]